MEFLAPEIQEYAEKHTTAESDLLQQLNKETYQKVLYPRMLSGHLQGRILSLLSKLHRPKTILEIGTYTGYSALCLAEGLVDGGKLFSIEIDPELKEFAQKFIHKAGMENKIELITGEALKIIPQFTDPIDLVFIDADKQNYIKYLQLVLPKLPKGGIVIADNVLWSGQVLNENAKDKESTGLRNFNIFVSSCEEVEQVLFPVRDGIMVIRKL